MVPDLKWFQNNFRNFNQKYFNNQLPMPKFSYRCPSNMWGCYNADALYSGNRITKIYSSGELCLTAQYSRNEKSIQNTLLHEMIHMYIFLVLKKKPMFEHGVEFNRLASIINQDGWKISAKNEMEDDDVFNGGKQIHDIENSEQKSDEKQIATPLSTICIVGFNDDNNNGVIGMRVNKNDISKSNLIKNSIKGAKSIDFYNIKSPGFSKEKIKLGTLYGFVAEDVDSLIKNMSEYYGEDINNFKLINIKMNKKINENIKKIIISENQEKKLIELLKEDEIMQMPVDKKMNKPYCIDPEKVLIVKKHLDNNFKKFKYTTLSGGKKKNIVIVGMMDGDNVLKYMYKDDLKEYLIDTFQKMFLDKMERELFLTKVMNAWFDNKIGVHGTLDVNFIK